jgi:2-haloalkanoic acid dehalogenase type II
MKQVWPKVVTFDCYGTLVQWPETLRGFFDSLLPSGADGAKFHKDFSESHVRLKGEPYRPYSQVLRLALAATMQKWSLGSIPSAQERLLHVVREIAPYPDAVATLASLAQKFRLAIISNTEDEMIAATVRGLGVRCDVITAQQARAYKPDHRLFDYAHERLGVNRDEVLHVGAGYATDMVPAFELGIARVWINRRGERPDPTMAPTAELPDLSSLEATIIDLVS